MSDEPLDLFDDADFESDPVEGADAAGDFGEAAVTPPAAASREPKVWSVYQVNKAVRGLLESSVEPLWVGGEIGSWTRSRPGHCYFSLKDDRAQIRAVMFAREASQLPADPDEGTKVRVFGDLTLYEARGEYQLVVRRLEPEGTEGLWRKAFEALRARLEAEGLLDAGRKRALPRYPACVGVVTSPTGAALHDIRSVLARRAPWTRIVLAGSRVQGEGAAKEIAVQIERLAATGMVDVLIVGRGGGSLEDLWAFNEEPVARAIAACPVPVISAVGHEVDVTIADLVADLRAPTPSAAAEAVVPETAQLLAALRRAPERLGRALRRTAARPGAEVRERLGRLELAIERRLSPARQSVDLAALDARTRVCGCAYGRRARAADGGGLSARRPIPVAGSRRNRHGGDGRKPAPRVRGNRDEMSREQDGVPTLETRLSRLEEILARMESDDVALEEALALFEEGVAHVREAEKVLSATELRVEELLASGQTRAMEEDDDA